MNESTWGLAFIKALNPAKYSYIPRINEITQFEGDPSKKYFGVMAQDIERYIKKQNCDPKEFNILNFNDDFIKVNYIELIGPIIKSIKDLDEKIKSLQDEINIIKKECR